MPIGTNFDDFLKEEGVYESSAAAAAKKLLSWQIEEAMKAQSLTKTAMGKPLNDQALCAWEDSRDMAAELAQSINEMLTGQGEPVRVSIPSPCEALPLQSSLKS